MTGSSRRDGSERTDPANSPRFDAIVVAAGESRRMDGIDKLSAPIGGRPLLAWTVRAIADSAGIGRIVIATAEDRIEALSTAAWLPDSVVAVVAGGDRRQASVAAGFAALDPPDDRVVIVHDGARPAVTATLVASVAAAAAAHGAAIPVLIVTETVKRIAADVIVETVDRSGLATAQTPQAVRAGLLRAAWAAFPPDGPDTFTDEAALLEAARIPVHAIPGDPMNVKVTVPDDLAWASAALLATAIGHPDGEPSAGRLRVGFGIDSHPFGPGEPLALGGVTIGGPRLHGHSDGDVALHAVADALLGASGLGDLGRLFPADRSTPEGIASAALLEAVVEHLQGAGFRPASVDLTIVGARPRLVDGLDAMRDAIAGLLGLDSSWVDVKASTGNLIGMEGAGRGMSAHAVAVVERTPSVGSVGFVGSVGSVGSAGAVAGGDR